MDSGSEQVPNQKGTEKQASSRTEFGQDVLQQVVVQPKTAVIHDMCAVISILILHYSQMLPVKGTRFKASGSCESLIKFPVNLCRFCAAPGP